MNYICEITKEALAPKDRIPLGKVQNLFFPGNPWLVDWVEDVDDSIRQELIDDLGTLLPEGYSISGDEILIITNESKPYSDQFKQEILSKMDDEGLEILRKGSPYLWFKQVFVGAGSALAIFENEVHTLNEFLLLLSGHGYNMTKLFIGSIFGYHY